ITQKLKAELLADASQHIAILQDIIDYDTPTDDERYELVAWKKYRIELSRIRPENAPKITWPSKPE
ncbi:tail fiber assembly protein, partial [Enterobacter ludwigii]|uniref:tail fiber assembly protein n=1 Tax=Enterobacter ludwigii TaxID=299767 RepID=UPI003F71F5ED